MEKKKICFIVNPISGIGRQKVIEQLVATQLDHAKFEHSIAYTEAAKHATALAAKAAAGCFDIVVAVGGDGSVNETAAGLIDTKAALAVIPTGSGNGLARHLQIPLNLAKAIGVINTGRETIIDSVQLNEHVFVNVAGIGFDAHIGWEFAKFGRRGFSSYLRIISREFPKYKAQHIELIADGRSMTKKAFLISFANGSQWGNNAFIAPLADCSDGLIDIAIIKKFNLLSGISVGYRLFTGSVHRSAAVEMLKAREVTVKQSGTIAHIDGEPIETGHELHIKVRPLSLRVIIPS